MCYAIIGAEGDFYFLIEEHKDIQTAKDRSKTYFTAAFCAPFNDDLLNTEFKNVIALGESDYLHRRKREHYNYNNEIGSIHVVEY